MIDLIVDTNRDGKVDATDQEGEDTWDATHGAMFLPNLDDDDEDEIRDADDVRFNDGFDAYDLAQIKLSACEECPEGSKGQLVVDAASVGKVRIFKLDQAASTWTLVAGEMQVCTEEEPTCAQNAIIEISDADVHAGVLFTIEGRDVMRGEEGGWTGYVDLTYTVTDADGAAVTSDDSPDGTDKVRMRVSPWQLFGNLHPHDRVWSSNDSDVFVNGIEQATNDAGLEYERYNNYGDQWTQDFFQTGFFAVTRADETGATVVHGMTVANARPWGRTNSDSALPIRWLTKNYLGPDHATLVVYKTKHSGDSYDSHGNHDLLPPYENGDQKFPMGRILIGSGVLPETELFYNAQGLQSPYYVADTAWLYVGHVDEYLSYVPANTPRGWKLLIGSPMRGREMLLEAQADGNGAVLMHEGKFWYDFDGGGTYAADITIDEVLANQDLLEASEEAQAEIDDAVEKLVAELGLADDEVIEMPGLFENIPAGGTSYKLAYQPGTVNSLVFGDYIVVPKPFGPQIGGEDIFEADILQKLSSASSVGADGEGMEVYFTDNWDLYHRLSGEVHCGSNPEAFAPFSSVNWWETGR